MFNNYLIFTQKLYIAPIPIIFPNKTFKDYINIHLFNDFECYKLIKNYCFY